ncbi:MAG: hypothetical protein AVDCRST_MAG57-638, partial [uncultured Blastococcus sp.]
GVHRTGCLVTRRREFARATGHAGARRRAPVTNGAPTADDTGMETTRGIQGCCCGRL